jgi:hypothetical protein
LGVGAGSDRLGGDERRGRDIAERRRIGAQRRIERVRHRREVVRDATIRDQAADFEQRSWIADLRRRPEQQSIDHGKHGRVGADAKRERRDDDECEHGLPAEGSTGIGDIAPPRVESLARGHPVVARARCVVHPIHRILPGITKSKSSFAIRLLAGESTGFELRDTKCEMAAQFLIDVCLGQVATAEGKAKRAPDVWPNGERHVAQASSAPVRMPVTVSV